MGKTIKELAFEIGVDLTLFVQDNPSTAESVHKTLHNLAERFVMGLEMDELAEIIGANPDLLGRQVPFNAVEKSFEMAMKDSLKWALIEASAGYRADAEASIIHGKVADALVQFSERLKAKANDGTLAAHGVENVTVFIDRVVRRGGLDGIDLTLLMPIVTQMGTYASRIRASHAAASGLRVDHVRDTVLDTVSDLAFLAERNPKVLVDELSKALSEAVRGRNMAR